VAGPSLVKYLDPLIALPVVGPEEKVIISNGYSVVAPAPRIASFALGSADGASGVGATSTTSLSQVHDFKSPSSPVTSAYSSLSAVAKSLLGSY